MSAQKTTPVTITFENLHGRTVVREFNQIANARDFVGTAAYPWVIMAANPDVSGGDLQKYLRAMGTPPGRSWLQRKRWMFHKPDADVSCGPRANWDGNYSRAVQIMHENPTMSARRLAALLRENGIQRNKDWVLKHRCDPVQ